MRAPSTVKPRKKVFIFNSTKSDFELVTAAAKQEEISRSELMRQAVREKAIRVLSGLSDHLADQRGLATIYIETPKKDPES